MTPVAMTPPVDSDNLIAEAKRLLASGRSLTAAEQQHARDALYRLNETTDRVGFATLSALYTEIDRLADARLAAAIAEKQRAAQHELDESKRKKPERWAALTQDQRAAFILELELSGNSVAMAIRRFVELAMDVSTASRTAPDTFEPVKW